MSSEKQADNTILRRTRGALLGATVTLSSIVGIASKGKKFNEYPEHPVANINEHGLHIAPVYC